ncbi:MAG: FtsB family cell division protein [bacterium JZ-2024 1]
MRSLFTAETWLGLALVYFSIHATVFLLIQAGGAVHEALSLRRLSRALSDIRRQDALLQQQAAILNDRDEMIRLARKNEGFVFPGEEIYRVPSEQPSAPDAQPQAPQQSSRARDFWQGLRRLFFRRASD